MASKKTMRISQDLETQVIHLGEMEIWDGADLALLRETLTKLITQQKARAVGVDMSYVKYVPSGFFGMLFDWHDTGVEMRVYSPQPNVHQMLWFRRFFVGEGNGSYRLCAQSHEAPTEPRPLTTEPAAVEDWTRTPKAEPTLAALTRG